MIDSLILFIRIWFQERTVELEQSCTDLAERYNTVVEEFEVFRAHFIGLDGENATLSEQIKVPLINLTTGRQ